MSDFPPEIWEHILLKIALDNHHSLRRFRTVSRSFKNLIDNSSTLQYQLALVDECLVDGPPSQETAKQRLDILNARKAAWQQFDCVIDETLLPEPSGCWELSAGVYGYTTRDARLAFVQLSSRFCRREAKTWSYGLPFRFHDFTFDPSQDLLAIMGRGHSAFEVRLLSLTTGQPHRDAQRSILTHGYSSALTSFNIRLHGPILCILFHQVGAEHQFIVWNWKSGQVLLALDQGPSDFWCLTEDLVVLAVTTNGKVYLKIVDIRQPSLSVLSHIDNVPCLCSLSLPQPKFSPPRIVDFFVDARADGPGEGVPFATGGPNRLLVVRLRGSGSSLSIFILASTLMNLVKQSKAATRPQDTALKWPSWGEKTTRILPLHLPTTWICVVHGLKFSYYDTTKDLLYLYDFNQYLVRQHLHHRPGRGEDHQGWTVFRTSNLINSFNFTKSDLPYRRKAIHVLEKLGDLVLPRPESTLNSVMISEDSIILVPYDERDGFRVLSF